MVSKRGYTPAIRVVEELEVVKRASALVEARENVGPARLLLVAVRELDVGVGDGVVRLWQLLEADNGDVLRRAGPGVVLDELAADAVWA